MLISKDKKISENDIVSFKIVTGEEIIAKVIETDNEKLVVSKPISMVLVHGHGGQAGISFVPFMVGVDEDAHLTFTNDKVITVAKANQASSAQYIQATTGLTAAPAGLDLNNIK